MRGKAPGQEREQDVLHASADCHKSMKRGEIDVFDAGKYFAGVENQRLRMKESPEMEDELDDEAKSADADGSLPLSPLPDFYISGKARHMHTKQKQRKSDDAAQRVYAGLHVQGKNSVVSGRVTPVQRQMASIDRNITPHGAPLQSPPAHAVSSHSTNPLPLESASDKSQGKSGSSSKPQAFSPSMRLASFLARFKLSSESKTKPQSTATSTSSGQQASTPPKSSFFSNASSLQSNGKPPSPRGRFLRALSSSSSHNSLLKPISRMHHHGPNIAASTPVSPAGSDPYSPITHSASTTPTSHKNPRSRPRSHVPTSPGSLDWRRDVDNSGSRNSLSAHLPSIRRKLRSYLRPEKSPRHHQESNHQQAIRNKQERMASNHDGHQVINGNRIASDKQLSVSNKLMALNHDPHQVRNSSNRIGEKQHRAANTAVHSTAVVDTMLVGAETTAAQGRHDREQRGNSMRSPAHRATSTMMADTNKLSSMKEIRRRGDWAVRRHKGEEVDDDIEVAERLLRVVKEHQSALSTAHQTAYAATNNNNNNHNNNMKGGKNRNGFGEQGSGLVAENGGATRKSRKSSSISPFSSPARYTTSTKEEYACPYDSDSSSDLFEIETLQAFSHVAGLYRPRDLPVYDNSLTKSPLHTSKKDSPY